jgi:large subunit ribosomal protein L25
MAHEAKLAAAPRSGRGKGAAREMRRQGRVPAVIYGHHRAAEALEVDGTALGRLLTALGSSATMVDVSIEGREPVKALIREVQRNPVRPSDVLHLDLYEVRADEKITVDVPVQLVGTPEGVRNSGGVLDQLVYKLTLKVFPGDLPDHIEVDVSALGIAQQVYVRDLKITNAEILTDANQPVCTVVPPRTEAAPGAVPAEVAEPELIRKPKAEEEAAEE